MVAMLAMSTVRATTRIATQNVSMAGTKTARVQVPWNATGGSEGLLPHVARRQAQVCWGAGRWNYLGIDSGSTDMWLYEICYGEMEWREAPKQILEILEMPYEAIYRELTSLWCHRSLFSTIGRSSN